MTVSHTRDKSWVSHYPCWRWRCSNLPWLATTVLTFTFSAMLETASLIWWHWALYWDIIFRFSSSDRSSPSCSIRCFKILTLTRVCYYYENACQLCFGSCFFGKVHIKRLNIVNKSWKREGRVAFSIFSRS